MNSFVAYLKGEHTSVRGLPSLFRLPVVQTNWIAGCHLQILPDCSCLACSASHSTVMLKCTSWIECTALCFKLWYWVSVENSPVKMIAKMTDLTAGMPQTPSFCQLYTFGFSGQGKLSSGFHWKCHSSLEAIFLFIYLKIYFLSDLDCTFLCSCIIAGKLFIILTWKHSSVQGLSLANRKRTRLDTGLCYNKRCICSSNLSFIHKKTPKPPNKKTPGFKP